VARVLDQFQHDAPLISTTFIDTGSPTGIEEYDRLIGRLLERERDRIQAQTSDMTAGMDDLTNMGRECEQVAGSVQALGRSVAIQPDLAARLKQRAGALRVAAQDAIAGVKRAGEALGTPAGPQGIPPLGEARSALQRAAHGVLSAITDAGADIDALAQSDAAPDDVRESASAAAQLLTQLRPRAAGLVERLDRLKPLDIERIGRLLESRSAALVIGPPGSRLAAMPFDRLFPSSAVIDAAGGARADLARNAESLIGAALAAVAIRDRPIVVITHAEPRAFFAEAPGFQYFFDRMARSGFDLIEWPAAIQPEAPSLLEIDPEQRRPVVYVVLPTAADAPAPSEGAAGGAERTARLGAAVARLVEAGQNVLLSLSPSVLPVYGQPDPLVGPLGAFGLSADTARPVLREDFSSGSRIVETEWTLMAGQSDTPIARGLRGLPTLLSWPVAIETGESNNGAESWVIDQIAAGAGWAESKWLSLRRTPRAYRGLMSDPPRPDDGGDDVTGPWPVVVAAQRRPPASQHWQRIVVVGSTGWFFDRIAHATQAVQGREVLSWPGNIELFEASVRWLAGQDELIAPGVSTRSIALVRPIAPGTLVAIRWLVIAGLPLGTLLIGGLWRLARG